MSRVASIYNDQIVATFGKSGFLLNLFLEKWKIVILASEITVNPYPHSATYMRRLFGAKPLPEPMLAYCQLDP